MVLTRKKTAYTLAEMLIVLMIIALIAIGSTPLLVKKGKKQKEKLTHGTYACTVFDGEEYFFHSDKKNDTIPYSKEGWARGKCGTSFVMPYKSGLLNVKLTGGGGAGGDASVKWDDSVAPRAFYDDNTYIVSTSGYYDIIVSGSKGSSSSVTQWNATIDGKEHNCFAETAKAGETAFFSGAVYLNKSDKIDIKFEHESMGSLNLDCSSQIQIPSSQIGQNGKDIVISKNSSTILRVEGSKAGSYRCNSANLCAGHFEARQGDNGSVTTYTSFADKEESVGSNGYDYGVVIIKWSDKNNTQKAFLPKAGCGGTAGEIRSALYPILRNKLPEVKVGSGGTSQKEAQDTTFGSLRASAGRNNVVCSTKTDDYNGVEGKTFSAIADLNSKGGAGGISVPTEEINGSDATGFSSGGGGGAIYFDTIPSYDTSKSYEDNLDPFLNGVQRWNQGSGGKGGEGLLIITW